jgi:chemotaxis protein methyltransferase CheR
MDIDDLHFEKLKREILKDTAIDFNQYKNNYLKRRLGVRMRACSVGTYDKYLNILTSNPTEYNLLLKDITINVTQFYRDPKVFKIIESELLPLIIYEKVKNKRRVIRVWSAGCATGEEPYSLAIALRDLLGEEFENFLVSIYGTDIDTISLSNAKIGKYLPRQVENIKPSFLKRYFSYDGEMYILSDKIKDMVRYKKHDLFTDNRLGHFDLILCRNVMIYFNKDMQEKLIARFYKALNFNGYLVIGKTEGLFGDIKDRFNIVNSRERIYQKQEKRKLKGHYKDV